MWDSLKIVAAEWSRSRVVIGEKHTIKTFLRVEKFLTLVYDKNWTMKILKIVFYILASVILLGIVTMLVLGKKYHYETSMVINAPIEKVYAMSNSSKAFNKWNPWMDLDPNIKVTYSGENGAVGDEYCWEGNDQVGQGCHKITGLVPNEKVATMMMFKKPFESDATSDIILKKEGHATKVTWSMDCELDYPMNIMKLFMDGQMDKSYGKGLSKLKKLAEQ